MADTELDRLKAAEAAARQAFGTARSTHGNKDDRTIAAQAKMISAREALARAKARAAQSTDSNN